LGLCQKTSPLKTPGVACVGVIKFSMTHFLVQGHQQQQAHLGDVPKSMSILTAKFHTALMVHPPPNPGLRPS
jgi:hypothetical protein